MSRAAQLALPYAMPLQNRVTPFGEIIAAPERGLMFGNRGGRFHDPLTRSLGRRRFVSRRWICCKLSFKGIRRKVFGKGYTELFFLDEATALAAGHRPCFECRRADALAFRDAFARGNRLATSPLADEMDVILHAERLSARPAIADWRDLPDSAMVAVDNEPCLVLDGKLLGWSLAGYHRGGEARSGATAKLQLLTPPAMVAAMRAGYAPRLHPSAGARPNSRVAKRGST
jgi:hypothetical protein